MPKVRVICHKKTVILMIPMYCVKKSNLGKIRENVLFVAYDVIIFISSDFIRRNGKISHNNYFLLLKITLTNESRKIMSGTYIEYLKNRICLWGLISTKIKQGLPHISGTFMISSHQSVCRILARKSGDYSSGIFLKEMRLAVGVNETSTP